MTATDVAWAFNEDAIAWRNAGFANWRAVKPWVDIYFDPELAREWKAARFKPADAQAWHGELFTPRSAPQWIAAGFTVPREAYNWTSHGFNRDRDARRAAQWRDAEVTPEDAEWWHRNRISRQTRDLWLAAGVTDGGIAAQWAEQKFTPTEAKRWVKKGCATPADIPREDYDQHQRSHRNRPSW